MDYLSLEHCVKSISQNMFEQICMDMDKFENKQYNHFFSLVNEIYKGFELCCHALEIQAYSQIGTLLRQLIEQVATAKVISMDEKALSSYATFAKAKMFCLQNKCDNSELEELWNKSTLSKNAKGNKFNFYSYGWIEAIGATKIDVDALLEVANMSDLYDWRKFCNSFVHSSLTTMNYATVEGISHYAREFTYILAVLCDEISCNYHSLTGFDFVFSGVDLFSKFRKALAHITQQ